MEFSQLIINYPEDKLCLHYEFNSNRRGSLTENAANTSPPLGWKRVKFKNSDEKSSQKTQDSSPKSSQNSRQNPRKRFVNCDGAKTMTVCRVNDWQRQAKKGLREVTETLNILTTVSLSQQQVHYLMTFVMIMIKVKSRFILISKQITNTLQDLLPARMMQTRKINLETDKITPNAEVFR